MPASWARHPIPIPEPEPEAEAEESAEGDAEAPAAEEAEQPLSKLHQKQRFGTWVKTSLEH